MGQLIKLQDYISRYENDAFHYPGHYIRLKQQQWNRVKDAWQSGFFERLQQMQQSDDWLDEKKSRFSFRSLFKKKTAYEEEGFERVVEEHDEIIQFRTQPHSLDDLKLLFLENIFRFQLKWASSTVRDKSDFDRRYLYDETLKYFLQRFPDTFLFMYQPIFQLKKAPVELDILLITPMDIQLIVLVEEEDESVFVGSTERFWRQLTMHEEKRMLSPLLAIQRMENIVRSIFQKYEIDLPIRKVLLSRNGYFDFAFPPHDVRLVDKRNVEDWLTKMRKVPFPLKHIQLKAIHHLLMYCQSNFVQRVEWELVDEEVEVDDFEQ